MSGGPAQALRPAPATRARARGKPCGAPHPSSAPPAAFPLADAGSAGPPRSQSRLGGGAAGSAGCSKPLRPDAPATPAAPAPRRRPRQQRPAMQEPLLGAEGPDYDTFPERLSPSPAERTRVGAPQNRRVFLATFAAVLGNFSFGYALVYTSPVIPALEHSLDPNLSLTKTQASWFGSVFTLGAAAGGLSAMVLNDLLGRKLSIMFSAVPSAAGYALMAGARGLWMLLLGRTLTGFAGGLTAACIPVYVSEIALPGVRGALGATPQLMAVFGSLSLYALGLLLPWRWLAVAGEGPVVIMILLLTFMPNSPRFLLSRGRDKEALQALAWLRGANADIRWEFQQIQDNVQRQLPEDDAAIVGAVRLLSVLIAAVTMDRAGRKVLLFVSASIMFAANLTLGLYVHFGPKSLTPNTTMGLQSVAVGGTEQPLATHTNYITLVPLLATMLFIMGYAMGWGPITWLLMSEILPLRARGMASGLCVLVSWLTAFALTKSFLLVVNAFGLQVPFFFFAAICLVNLVFTGCCVPETKGRSLEQIESFFRTGRRAFLH
ncbi:solute carrier family 2, facilitated glucose transporter member 6 isoform X2 [Rhinolophus ferrumequinum]|uniref:solute carrier family 2, facilitated glucose transporter member 6 isoform X2 n=1 Tax=Rhinolophus ferrumequinum TaxID=59479 RepID=UPI00140FF8BA|nr:solute carrier family 2, facilitated glucose transporter member 6 isoform X2 [Rhinolophus ferrumequinum]